MPKKNSSVRENSRLDAWWEYHYGDCHCYDIMCDRDGEELPCSYCRREAEQEAEEDRLSHMAHAPQPINLAPRQAPKPNPHQEAMDFISQKLTAFQFAKGVDAQIPLLRELFESVFTFQAFFAATPRMRTAVENKIAEFRADPRTAELHLLFDQVMVMLQLLGRREDYVS